MNKMTPMKRYSHGINQLKNYFQKAGFREKTLNSAKSQYDPYGGEHGFGGYSKGVVNDFTLLMNYNNQYSIGLVFNYKNEPVQVEATFCPMISKPRDYGYMADNKNLESSAVFTPEEFSQRLNQLNKTIKITSNRPKPETLIQLFKEAFEVDKVDIKQKIEQADKKIQNFLKNYESDLNDKEKIVDKKEASLKRAKKKVEKDYKESEEYKELEEIRKRERELLVALQSKKETLKEKYKVDEKQKEYDKAFDEYFDLSDEYFDLSKQDKIEKEKALKNLPKTVRQRVIR